MKFITDLFESKQTKKNRIISRLLKNGNINEEEGAILMEKFPHRIEAHMHAGEMSSGANVIWGDYQEVDEHAMNTNFKTVNQK
jgi:hypothetical protein